MTDITKVFGLTKRFRFFSVTRRFLLVLSAIMLTACASVSPPPEPVVVVQPEPPQNAEMLKALADLNELKEEMKQLRNAIEEMQFESENSKRRQQDLFADLDRRLLTIERNQQQRAVVGGGQSGFDSSNTSVSGTQQSVIGSNSSVGSADVVIVESAPSSNQPASNAGQESTGAVSVSEQEQYEKAFELLKQSRYEDAISEFQALVDTWPESQLADDGYYWMSEARYVNREFESALSGFRTVVTRYPDSQRVPEALLKVGYIQYDIGAYNDAADTFRDILARFPGHQVTVSAQTRLRRIEQTIQ